VTVGFIVDGMDVGANVGVNEGATLGTAVGVSEIFCADNATTHTRNIKYRKDQFI